MEIRPFVSVVIPCFNASKTIGECLTSLRSQTYPRRLFEVILADNGSIDDTRRFVATYFPDVRIVEEEQKGSGFARNAGFAVAKGELVLSTDSDCVCDVEWIEALVEAFRTADPNTAAIGGLIQPFSLCTMVEQYRKGWVLQPVMSGPDARVRYTATPNAGFRAEAFRRVGGFDGTLGFDDTDLGLRMQAAGFMLAYTDRAVIRHRNPSTLRDLYRHRQKYGEFNYALACKHPTVFGDPSGLKKRLKLIAETSWRVTADIVKLPFSMFSCTEGKPRLWPLIDVVMALGNYHGFSRSSRQAAPR